MSNLELVMTEEQGKSAKFIEHHIVQHQTPANNRNGVTATHNNQHHQFTNNNINAPNRKEATNNSKTTSTQSSSILSSSATQNSSIPTTTSNSSSTATTTVPNMKSADNQTWRTIGKRKKKSAEKKIFAKEIPGNIGDRPVDELEDYILRQNNLPAKRNQPTNQMDNNSNKQKQKQSEVIIDSDQSNKLKDNTNINSHNYDQILKYIGNSTNSQQPKQQSKRSVSVAQTDSTAASSLSSPSSSTSSMVPAATTVKQAVEFANHIKLHDEADNQYRFGFFNDDPNEIGEQQSVQESQNIVKMKNNQNDNTTSPNHKIQQNNRNISRKRNPSINQIDTNNTKAKQKQSNIIINSDRPFIKDKLNINSFNYDQILKFISNSWDNKEPLRKVAPADIKSMS